MKKIYLFITALLLLSTLASAQCLPSFSWTQSNPNEITFNNTTPFTQDSTTFLWQFGDNTLDGSRFPVHVYSDSGSFTVCLTVFDSTWDCSATFCQVVQVTGTPICNMTTTSYQSVPASCISCTDGMAYVNVYAGTPPFSYDWDNGNSTSIPNGIRTSYSINLDTGYHYVTVTDANGCVAHDSAWIFSGPQNFWAYPEFTKARMGGDTLLFHDFSGSNYPFLYTTWDFGDTTTGTGQWVSHYYPHADTFQVCMTLHDTVFNYTGQYCDTVIIRHPPPPTCFISIIEQVLSNNSMLVQSTPNIYNPHTSFVWSWGDGNYDSLVYLPTHVYANTGVYNLCLSVYDSTINCSDSSCIVVTVTSGNNPYTITTSTLPVGISAATKNELHVFPNPADDRLFFSGEWIGDEATVYVTDLSGRVLLSEKIHGNSIDCSGMTSGMYFLKIENEHGTAVQSFIRR